MFTNEVIFCMYFPETVDFCVFYSRILLRISVVLLDQSNELGLVPAWEMVEDLTATVFGSQGHGSQSANLPNIQLCPMIFDTLSDKNVLTIIGLYSMLVSLVNYENFNRMFQTLEHSRTNVYGWSSRVKNVLSFDLLWIDRYAAWQQNRKASWDCTGLPSIQHRFNSWRKYPNISGETNSLSFRSC